jgi:dienelactone hydrolase
MMAIKNTYLFLYLVLIIGTSQAQTNPKKQLTQQDYHLWGKLWMQGVSSDGKWTSYVIDYENFPDTLFVRNTTHKKSYDFNGVRLFDFMENGRFVSHKSNSVQILNLETGKTKAFEDISQYAYAKPTDNLILLASAPNSKYLAIINAQNKIIAKLDSVTHFSLSPTKKEILYVVSLGASTKVGVLNLENPLETIWVLQKKDVKWNNFVWHEKGKAFAFFEHKIADPKLLSVVYYNLPQKSLFYLDHELQKSFLKDKFVTPHNRYSLSISSDQQKVFFGVKASSSEGKEPSNPNVEIWNGNAKKIYPREKYLGKLEDRVNLAMWSPFFKKVMQVSSSILPDVSLTGDQKYALLSNPDAYEPQFEDTAPRDISLMDIQSGEIDTVFKDIRDWDRNFLPSPGGRYIAYFYSNNWWIYDLAKKMHKNVTENIPSSFADKIFHSLTKASPYGNPGWSKDDGELILYDEYDIWAIKPEGSFRKLTSGREHKITFRFAYLLEDFRKSSYNGFKSSTIDLSLELMLRAEGIDGQTGYYRWTNKTKEEVIVYSQSFIDQMHYNWKEQSFVYQMQSFDRPPSLIFQKKNNVPQAFYRSNPQQSNFYWGHNEMIEYQNSKGKKLKGILYYPANYIVGKKYPMIVKIYREQSKSIHKYYNPTTSLMDAYNPTIYTSNGYFVLCPDIVYELGNVGMNAVDCVTSATSSIINRGLVDAASIGLMGHSFGGYETNFIVTHTSLFAAAVAGSGSSDLVSNYLTVNWNTGQPDMWRFENDIYVMGTTPFEDPSTFTRNSPIAHAANVKTPLLLWTGKEDQQVNWHQSVEFYLALRRLKKETIMLLYPEEPHWMSKPNNQKDLYNRVNQWFDYYLKKEKPADWISKGTK